MFSHFGWYMNARYVDTDLDAVKDLAKFPELVWVNKNHFIFPCTMIAATYIIGEYTLLLGETGLGLSALVWIFIVSTVLSVNATFCINSLTHGMNPNFFNRRRFLTSDSTTNSWLLSIPTMGASWHNNHHRFMNSARAGFYWWEIDLAYLMLKFLSFIGIVWDLQQIPEHILEEGRSQKNSVSEDTSL